MRRSLVDGGIAAKMAPFVRKWSPMATKMAKAYVSKANHKREANNVSKANKKNESVY